MRMIIILVVLAAVGYAGWRYYNERPDVAPPDPVIELSDEEEPLTVVEEENLAIPPVEDEEEPLTAAEEENVSIPPAEDDEEALTAVEEENVSIPPVEDDSGDEAPENDPQ